MSELSFTAVDVLFALIILASAAYAAWRGLIRETLSIFSWAVSAYVTLRFFPTFRPMLRGLISPEWLSDAVVFVGMLVIMLVPLSFLAYRISEAVKKSPVSAVDRVLGFVFGIVRGAVVIGIAYITFATMTGRSDPDWLTRTKSYPLVLETSDLLLNLVPETGELTSEQTGINQIPPRPQPARRQAAGQNRQAAPQNTQAQEQSGYDAGDRSELDRLIQATGGN